MATSKTAAAKDIESGSIRSLQYRKPAAAVFRVCLMQDEIGQLMGMLNFNAGAADEQALSIWKVLVLDSVGQSIVSPILKVNDLREQGVTLFLQLKQTRERVEQVPAVYFVEPSTANIDRILQDVNEGLYAAFYLNFTSRLSRELLERLATGSLASGHSERILQVYDQYAGYVALEDWLFSCRVPGAVAAHTSGERERIAESVSESLFSVFMTLGSAVPMLARVDPSAGTSPSPLSAMVQTRLEARLKAHLINTKSSILMSSDETVSAGGHPNSRPLLLLLDRNFDWTGVLKHSSHYNALVDEILGLDANRITIPAAAKQKSQVFDIDMRDWFWRGNAGKPFPTVAENVETALKAYKADYDRVLQTTPGITEDTLKMMRQESDGGSGQDALAQSLSPEQLRIAISVLPDLTERKRLIDTHLQVSTALLESIKQRDLGQLFHLEQGILGASMPGGLLQALQDPRVGDPLDKLRVLILALLTSGQKDASGIEAMARVVHESLNRADPETARLFRAFEYLRQTQMPGEHRDANVSKAASVPGGTPNPTANNSAAPSAAPPTSLAAASMSGTALLGTFMSGMKQVLGGLGAAMASPASGGSPIVKIVEEAYAAATGPHGSHPTSGPSSPSHGRTSLHHPSHSSSPTSPRSPSSTATPFVFADPRPKQALQQASGSLFAIDHVVVVVLGGASYAEYNDLRDHFGTRSSWQHVKVTLGATEMLTARKALQILSELGQ